MRRLQRTLILPCALAVLVVLTVTVEAQRASPAASPGPQPTLAVTRDGDQPRVILRDGARESGSIAVPRGVAAAALDAAIANALWHPGRRDVAFAVDGETGSFVVVFVERPDRTHVAVDVSQIERRNIGGVGPDRRYPVRRTRPVAWLADRQLEGLYAGRAAVHVRFRTELRDDAGTRYAAEDALLITRDGTPLWR